MSISEAGLLISIVSLIVSLSGWGTLLYKHITASPNIKGRILNCMIGRIDINGRQHTSFTAYPYLTNNGNNAVNLLDYELEVDFGEGFLKLQRLYGLDFVPQFNFTDANGNDMEIQNFKEKLIYNKNSLCQYGNPVHGFIIFVGDITLYDKADVKKTFKLTCIDAFGEKHHIVSASDQFPTAYLFLDMAGIKLTPVTNS